MAPGFLWDRGGRPPARRDPHLHGTWVREPRPGLANWGEPQLPRAGVPSSLGRKSLLLCFSESIAAPRCRQAAAMGSMEMEPLGAPFPSSLGGEGEDNRSERSRYPSVFSSPGGTPTPPDYEDPPPEEGPPPYDDTDGGDPDPYQALGNRDPGLYLGLGGGGNGPLPPPPYSPTRQGSPHIYEEADRVR